MNYAANWSLCLKRILQEVDLSYLSAKDNKIFRQRLDEHFPTLFDNYVTVYGHQFDCHWHLQQLVTVLAQGFKERSVNLKKLDQQRIAEPLWYRSEEQIGMAAYVDLLGPTLRDLIEKIPYFKSLGVTYLHLMPLYAAPEGDSDGGYAVSDYRKVDPKLGNVKDLKALATALQNAGINLVLDFVFNHTSDEHEWALKAKQGEVEYQDYYYLFADRSVPEQYEHTLREIFPQVRRGSFTFDDTLQKWVWTTFNSFQWDLNYSNPAVFNAITGEMLFLANLGSAALRLDALAFIWKEMGTNCENQAKAHTLIQSFNRCLQIVAPAVVFKSEAIVHPDEVLKYIDKDECQLSYNPLLMALLWNSLATRKTRLLTASMKKSFSISDQCAWVNYVRCHDDIGWTFDDAVAYDLGINPNDHRYFLNQFFTGRFEGTFAHGVPFAENPSNGDCRVCGSLASLCGLENALAKQDDAAIDIALKRMALLYGIVFSIGGIPLLYSSDELGLLNDYSYEQDPSKQHDQRWVHRITVSDDDIALVNSNESAATLNDLALVDKAKIAMFQQLQLFASLRKQHRVFGQARTIILDSGNQHCFAFLRHNVHGEKLVVLANFSESPQQIDNGLFKAANTDTFEDMLDNAQSLSLRDGDRNLILQPYQLAWLKPTAS